MLRLDFYGEIHPILPVYVPAYAPANAYRPFARSRGGSHLPWSTDFREQRCDQLESFCRAGSGIGHKEGFKIRQALGRRQQIYCLTPRGWR